MANYLGTVIPALLLGVAAPALAQSSPPAAPSTAAVAAQERAVGDDLAVLTPPPGWSVESKGRITLITPPEGDAAIAVLLVKDAADADAAIASAWREVRPGAVRDILLAQDEPAKNGWSAIRSISYLCAAEDKYSAEALAHTVPGGFVVVLIDGALGTVTKRGAQINALLATLTPKGYVKESFAGRTAHPLDAARVGDILAFAEQARKDLGIPGVGLALVDDGKVVWEGGLGVADLESGQKVGKDTLFMAASNTKGMTTLLLATLVAEGKLDWDRPATDYMPRFRLGSEATTAKVLVRHLVCACTGLPRTDYEWILNSKPGRSAEDLLSELAAIQPTSEFGEVYQYNNQLPAAAGFIAASLIHPERDLGSAYSLSMEERIFSPLAMTRSTFDWSEATSGDWARPYGVDLRGQPVRIDLDTNLSVVASNPSGGVWSSAHDMALYVLNELNEGVLPSGKWMIAADALLARRAHNITAGDQRWYGMGLHDDASSGVSVLSHGGSMFGYKSGWYAIPQAEAGIVVLTNSDNGYALTQALQRKLLEVLYDGKPAASGMVANSVASNAAQRNVIIEKVPLPVPAELRAKVTGRFVHPKLGVMTVSDEGDRLMLTSTSMRDEVGVLAGADGSLSIIVVGPVVTGLLAQVVEAGGKRQLVFNDGQNEYRADEL